MYKRWYDIEPTVSLAISLIRNANILLQYKCADLIVEKAEKNGIYLSDNIISEAFNFVLRRWYDNDQKISEAFEYLKIMPESLQKELAIELIEFLQKEEMK